jgi:pyruvate dehydrogenase E1 component alpha subunit
MAKKQTPADSPKLPPKDVSLHLLRTMLLGRRFEERCAEMYALQKIGGFCHLGIGQEASSVGAISVLEPDDYIYCSYREHVHALAKGADPGRLMAELFGREGGVSRGKGGSMHLFDVSKGLMGGHGIVGGHLPLALGTAFAMKYLGQKRVTLCFFGEAAVNIGTFHESLNMAALWKLPVVFICENNRYGMGTALERASAVYDVSARACAYDMASETMDGMDVLAVRDVVGRAVRLARDESAPTLIESRCYRFMGHSMSDPVHGHYRTREEVEEQKQKDPIRAFYSLVESAGHIDAAGLESLDKELRQIVDEAIRFADSSPEPVADSLYADVYSVPYGPYRPGRAGG